MASSIIHIAVAKEINQKLKMDQKLLFLGSIAPDIAKEIGISRSSTHFQKENEQNPNIKYFLQKYKNNLKDPFVMGYYIHLYTDYLWAKYFIDQVKDDWIKNKNNNSLKLSNQELIKLIYNDYTNLNIKIIDYYNIPLDIFYEEFPLPKKIIKEIPYTELPLIIKKEGNIIKNSTNDKEYLFNIEDINIFISISTKIILSEIKKHIS